MNAIQPQPNPRYVSIRIVFCFLLGVCISVLFTRQILLYYNFIIDDTFISLVYAKNFIRGNGITFNGEYVAGYSNFLWVIVLSLPGFLGIDLVLSAKMLGIACACCTLALLVIIGRRIFQDALSGLIACILLSVSSPYIIWSVAGLETLGFTLLLLASIYLIVREEQRGAIRWSVLTLVALALTRPEGIGLVVALSGMRLLSRLLQNRTSVRSWSYIAGSVLPFVLYACFIGWHTSYYSYPFATTMYAKTGDTTRQIKAGAKYLLNFESETKELAIFFVCCLPFVFISPRRRLLNSITLGAIGAYVAFIIISGGDWMPVYRFIVPLLPLIYFILAQEMIIVSSLYMRIYRPLGAVIGVLIVILAAWSIWQASSTHDDEVHFVARTSRSTEQLAKLMATLMTPDNTVALIDAGAIPYYTEAHVIDMVGLNDNHIAHLPGGFMEKYDNQYVLSRRPDFVEMHISGQGIDAYSTSFIGTAKLYYSVEFHQYYEPIAESPHIFRRRAQPLSGVAITNFYSATYEVALPAGFAANTSATLPITLINQGWLNWQSPMQGISWGAISVGAEWRDSRGHVILRNARVRLKRRVRPGQRWSLMLPVQAPAASGSYSLVVDISRDYIYRFSEKGVPPFTAQVEVR
jgi:arabinofuranosyltransferase